VDTTNPNVLVGVTDGHEIDAALDYAAAAMRRGCGVHLVHVQHPGYLGRSAAVEDDEERRPVRRPPAPAQLPSSSYVRAQRLERVAAEQTRHDCFAADCFGTVLTAPARPGQRLRLLTQPKNTNSVVRSATAR
jgi:hypothetical protein